MKRNLRLIGTYLAVRSGIDAVEKRYKCIVNVIIQFNSKNCMNGYNFFFQLP